MNKLTILVFLFFIGGCASDDGQSTTANMGVDDAGLPMDAAEPDSMMTDVNVPDAAMPDATPTEPLSLDRALRVEIPDLPTLSIQPSVAFGPDGEVAVTFCGSEESDLGIWFTLLNSDGSVRVPTYQLDTTNQGIQNEPDICPLPDGGYAVVWSMDAQEPGPDGENLYLRYRLIGADGQPMGESDQQALPPGPGNRWLGEVACDPGGGFVAVGSYAEPNMTFGVFAQKFDGSGTPSGPPIELNADPEGSQVFPSIAIGPDGQTAIAWENRLGFGTDDERHQIVLRRFDSPNMNSGSEEVFVTDAEWVAARPEVAIEPLSGDAIIGASVNQTNLALYRVSIGEENIEDFDERAGSYMPALAPLGDGRLGILFLSGTARDVSVMAAIVDGDGIATDMAELARGPLPPYPTATAAQTGRFAVAWTERLENNRFGIKLALFGEP